MREVKEDLYGGGGGSEDEGVRRLGRRSNDKKLGDLRSTIRARARRRGGLTEAPSVTPPIEEKEKEDDEVKADLRDDGVERRLLALVGDAEKCPLHHGTTRE